MVDSEVLAFLEAVVQCDPNDVDAHVALGWLQENERHDFDAAVEHLQKAITISAKSAEAAFWLAKVYFHHGARLEMARETLERVLSINPDHVPSLSLLAGVYRDMDKPERAIPLLSRALALAPSWIMLHADADYAYFDVRDFERSAKHAKEAARLGEEFRKVSTPGSYSYFEAAVTGRWVTAETLARLKQRAAQASRGASGA